MRLIIFSFCSIIFFASCRKMAINRMCISVDKTTVAVGETVTVSECADRSPSKTSLDWGDGTTTDGLAGTHSYTTRGTYTIKVIYKDKEADDDDLRKTVTVQ